MNIRLIPLLLPVLAHSNSFAGDLIFTDPAKESPWRVGAGYAQLLGLKTEFRGLGRSASPNVVQPLGSGLDRQYDNGFVKLDSSGNAGGETWNWGYESAGQYNAAGGGSISYSITESLANAQVDENDGGHPGVELFAYYDMGAASMLGGSVPNSTWGFRFGLQYSQVGISNHNLLRTGLSTTNDSFNLGGTIAPLAPYSGSFTGPGPLLEDSPTRSVSLDGFGLVGGSRDLELDLTILSLGSYLEIPVTEKFHILYEAGLSLGVAAGSYGFVSDTTIDGLGTQRSRGSNSETEFLPGVYMAVGASYEIDESWSIVSSARYQYMSNFDVRAGDSESTISFDSAFVLSFVFVHQF